MLEKESGIHFNLDFSKELLITGKFDEAENYWLGFTKLGDDYHYIQIIFQTWKQKYIAALDRVGIHLPTSLI